MKKIVTLVALSIIITGCVSSGKVSVKREQLEHHRFVLESVNGKTVTGPELSFGEDMCAGRYPQRALQQRRTGRFNREPINAGDGRNNANV